MAELRQTGWDFDAPPASRKAKEKSDPLPCTVSQITARIKSTLETEFGSVSVRGEISNLRLQSSGHAYFALKDEGAQLLCVMFKSAGLELKRLLADGLSVLASGEIGVYEPRGQYQLIVRHVVPEGQGALQVAFEKLKQKLREEGLFDADRKRPIPRYPRRVGLVTSPTGAALRDVLHVLARRDPGLELFLAPCRVQGAGAADEICKALQALNEWSEAQPLGEGLQVVVLTRGGGSLEDLWCFNEEKVARAIRASAIPVISAVGHEIDFSISDFAADLRAATPSAAAEILSEGAVLARDFVTAAQRSLSRAANRSLESNRDWLTGLSERLVRTHPRRIMETHVQHVDDLVEQMKRSWQREFEIRVKEIRALSLRTTPSALKQRIVVARSSVMQFQARFAGAARHKMKSARASLDSLEARLESLSPTQVLRRGYSITTRASDGSVVRRPAEAGPGTLLHTRIAEGLLSSRVTESESRDGNSTQSEQDPTG